MPSTRAIRRQTTLLFAALVWPTLAGCCCRTRACAESTEVVVTPSQDDQLSGWLRDHAELERGRRLEGTIDVVGVYDTGPIRSISHPSIQHLDLAAGGIGTFESIVPNRSRSPITWTRVGPIVVVSFSRSHVWALRVSIQPDGRVGLVQLADAGEPWLR
jgi:hypothetical protein